MGHGRWRRNLLGTLLVVLVLLGSTAASASALAPGNTMPPSISGTPVAGQTLTASPGLWTGEPTEFRYRWERCGKVDATCVWFREESPENESYVVTPEDVGSTLRVRVTAVNGDGKSDPVTSASIEVERAWQFVSGPPKIEVAGWGAGPLSKSEPPIKGKTLTIGVSSGYCLGEPKPVVDHISVMERPKTARRPFKSAVITAFVRFPAPTEVVGTVNKGEPGPGCAGLGLNILHRVRLKRPASDLFIFDGSHSPPRRVLRPARTAMPVQGRPG